MAAPTDRQVLQALVAAVNSQLTAAGQSSITLARLGRVLTRGLARIGGTAFSTPTANQWQRDDGTNRSYIAAISGGRVVELHMYPTGSALHLYSGSVDTTSDSPLDGLTHYYREDGVDTTSVADDTGAWAWLTARVNAGLPSAP